MTRRNRRIYQTSLRAVCLSALLTFVFYPGLHKLEHSFEDRPEALDRQIHEAGCPDHCRPSESEIAKITCFTGNHCPGPDRHHDHNNCGDGLNRECFLCQALHLLSLSSLSMPAGQTAVRLPPPANHAFKLSIPPGSGSKTTNRARAPPPASRS